jgi:hypothetical protein
MTAIYILVVQAPPREKHGCLSCQFEDDRRCTVSEGRRIGYWDEPPMPPDWCPLQRVELEVNG